MTAKLREVPAPAPLVDADAIERVEGLLERLRSGESVACAVVEVRPGSEIATWWPANVRHHELLSGAAALMTRLASLGG